MTTAKIPFVEPPLQPAAPKAGFRSGAVARMSGMPVSTLRIWEQRYRAVGPGTAPSGHRLYSVLDVERVVLLRRLTERGHAIGLLAGMDIDALHELSLAHTAARAPAGLPAPRRCDPLRIVVVGQAMARRLERPSVSKHWRSQPEFVAVFDSLAQAAQAVDGEGDAAIDLLLWHAPDLLDSDLTALKAAQDKWLAHDLAVAYRFANGAARKALAHTGAHMVREPADDEALGAWLSVLESNILVTAGNPGQLRNEATKNPAANSTANGAASGLSTASDNAPWSLHALGLSDAIPPRRFEDAGLTTFASLPSSVACDCPGHVADLLMQIASFESYSASCSSRNAADAELHAYLHRVAAAARILFESALERVAIAEGYALPSSPVAP